MQEVNGSHMEDEYLGCGLWQVEGRAEVLYVI